MVRPARPRAPQRAHCRCCRRADGCLLRLEGQHVSQRLLELPVEENDVHRVELGLDARISQAYGDPPIHLRLLTGLNSLSLSDRPALLQLPARMRPQAYDIRCAFNR
eukprot:scaffold167659_cov19-Prasinocladus_malaysianus.AAC.1